MSTNELIENLPRLGQQRSPKKFLKSRLRKARSALRAWHRRQYFLADARRDLQQAITQNEDIFIATAIVALAIAYAFAAVMGQASVYIFETVYSLTAAGNLSFALLAIIAIGVLAAATAWIAAFITNSMSIAILHGINRKQNRSVRQTLRQSLRFATRTTLAWALVAIKSLVPLMAAAVFSLVFIEVAPIRQNHDLLGFPILAALTGLVLSVAQLVNASLVPKVALFESNLNFEKAFARSQELVTHKGRLFLVSFYAVIVVAIIIEYRVSMLLQNFAGLQGLTFMCAVLATLIYANNIMAAFYAKRRRTTRA